jgi:hypothetical protein
LRLRPPVRFRSPAGRDAQEFACDAVAAARIAAPACPAP